LDSRHFCRQQNFLQSDGSSPNCLHKQQACDALHNVTV
jgi:hypothetical protein